MTVRTELNISNLMGTYNNHTLYHLSLGLTSNKNISQNVNFVSVDHFCFMLCLFHCFIVTCNVTSKSPVDEGLEETASLSLHHQHHQLFYIIGLFVIAATNAVSLKKTTNNYVRLIS